MLLSTSPTPMCLKCDAQTRLHSEQLACGDRRMFVFECGSCGQLRAVKASENASDRSFSAQD
jgi:hypothetical protein